MKNAFYKLALWTQTPGDDFDKPWAMWLLDHEKLWSIWEFVVGGTIGRLYCLLYGHIVTDDHCGNPEHRFCFACRKPTPNASVYRGRYSVNGIMLILILLLASCGGGDEYKPNKAELDENWGQFKHDASFNVWVFEGDRPQEHRTPNQVRVFWNGAVTDEEKSLIDGGLSEMLASCRKDSPAWSPPNIWTKFIYFQAHADYKVIFVPSNYTLQEGEAAGCAGMVTGPHGVFMAAGTVGGLNDRVNDSRPGSKGGIYIVIPKQSEEQLRNSGCKTLMKNAVRNEAEHVWMTNDTNLYFAHANDGVNGNHPYCAQ